MVEPIYRAHIYAAGGLTQSIDLAIRQKVLLLNFVSYDVRHTILAPLLVFKCGLFSFQCSERKYCLCAAFLSEL